MAADPVHALSFVGPPSNSETALAALSEPIRRWFVHHFGEPTAAQRLAWPSLATGNNLLLSAPTGSGKTLAAFLPVLDQLLARPAPGTHCLYVSPLKALANDARKNLRLHLRGLRGFLPAAAPTPRVGVRTGDTSARARRRLRLSPPDILLTTPESLAVLLAQPTAAAQLRGLRYVVVDEVHAVAVNKRGADLSLSLERLAALADGGLQRIGLSATCTPPAEAGRFLVGTSRPCAVACVADEAPLQVTVEPLEVSGSFMARLVERLEPELGLNRSTLVFTNTRGLAERLGWALRHHFPSWEEQIAVHHSALAPARRRGVERQLKQGRLRAVVSSTSLELGIDIGSVDAVVLVHPPGDVVRLLQRVGRAGHQPGRARHGLVLTSTPAELLEATVTATSGRAAEYEPLRVLAHPLDVLCQQLVGMAAQQPWTAAEVFQQVREAYPYRNLPRADFDACVAYLLGRHADGRDWLPPRLRLDGECHKLHDRRTARLLLRNLGTILADEARAVRLCDGPAVGEVDEAFADRLQPGDRFLLDGRCLEFRRSDGPQLLVEEVAGRPAVPRWGGEGWPLSAELAGRLYLLRVRAAEALREGPAALAQLLHQEYRVGDGAVRELVAHFERQECLSEVPDAGTFLVEVVAQEDGADYYLHTPLNRAGNDALARLVVRRWARRRGRGLSSVVADLGLALLFRGGSLPGPDDLRALLAIDAFDTDFAEAVNGSETLREHFRRAALIGLMLLRNPMGGRRRVGGSDWPERRLFELVRGTAPDFVLLRQAEREVREECCDAAAARVFLEELPRRVLRWRCLARVSPFAEGWTRLGAGPVETVETPAEALQRLHALLTAG